MNIDINTIINLVLTGVVGYISWSFKDRDEKKEERIRAIEEGLKDVSEKLAENHTKYFREFITKEEHETDINALLKKFDETNSILRKFSRDIGELVGRMTANE